MAPPGLSQRSRAAITGASIPSSIPNPPSHSETITSTGSGSSTSSTSPWITSMISPQPVRGGKPLREHGDRRPLHRVHARSSCPRREHAQDPASRSDVEHDVARAHHSVDRTPEALGAHAVADHRPVHLELGIHRVRRVPDRRPHRSLLGCWGGVLPDRRRSRSDAGPLPCETGEARRGRPSAGARRAGKYDEQLCEPSSLSPPSLNCRESCATLGQTVAVSLGCIAPSSSASAAVAIPIATRSAGWMKPSARPMPPARRIASRSGTAQ